MKKLRHLRGQVFLSSADYINKIVGCLDINGRTVVEIGPGRGAVTKHLIPAAASLYAVESDVNLCEFLKKEFSAGYNVEIINKNILDFDLSAAGKDMVVFGNIPYYISTSIIKYLVKNRGIIGRVYLTCQKEFVDKMIAGPSTDDYVFLSCFVQYYAKVAKIFDIPAGAFSPVPKVDSSFVKMEFYRHNPYKVNEKYLLSVIKKAFSQRRKKIVNSLSFLKNKEERLLSLNISPESRAEDLSLDDYVAIVNIFYR